MSKQYMHRLNKIQNLLKELDKIVKRIDFIDFEVNVRDNAEEEFNLHKATLKYNRVEAKLRKQMAKYLEETNG